MIYQFFVLSKEGQLIHVRTYSGLELDKTLVTGFFSSISSFTGSLADQSLRSLVLDRSKFTYLEAGDFVLVAHGAAEDADAIVRLQLAAVLQMLTFLVGDPQQWTAENLTLGGLDDVVDHIVERYNSDIGAVAAGFPKVALERGPSELLERLLASLEAHGDVHGSLLLLGRSVLHSRLPVADTRLILSYAAARPLGAAAARTTPVFSEGRWRQLVLYRLRTACVALVTGVQLPYDALAPHLAAFERRLAEAGLALPIDEPPLQLRQFAAREALAFVYSNARSGQSVVPQMRPAPPIEQQRTADAFRWFTARAAPLLAQEEVRDVQLYREGYRFHAHREGPHALYLLCTDQVRAAELEGMAAEIQKACALRSGGS